MKHAFLVAGTLLLVIAPARSVFAQAIGPACSEPAFRQFDFWIGAWAVTDSTGAPAGTNVITRQADGCALREEWTGAGGGTGTSLTYYDAAAGRWHQQWVGGGGVLLHLEGGLQDGAMVLGGARETPQGPVTDRIRWTPLPDGRVRQEWTASADGGQSWNLVFLGFYNRR